MSNRLHVFWGTTAVLIVVTIVDFFANLLAAKYPTVQSYGWDVSVTFVLIIWIIAGVLALTDDTD